MSVGTGARPEAAANLWHPLRTPIFRHLLVAAVVSDVGTFMQGVGSAWLMVSLGAGPLYVALTQTASTLPFVLLALPAGSIGDIVDRRRLILYTESWMALVAAALAVTTISGVMTPWLLLALTFALSAGDAIETPTWRAVLPELVRAEDLGSASALNGIEFNVARAIGPAVAGGLIAVAGVTAAFSVSVVSFLGVIVVIARWPRPVHARTTPAETLGGATIAAVRYIRNTPEAHALMLRTGMVTFCASAPFALLPAVAHEISPNAISYGVLLGCFGTGAVAGAVVMQRARARWSTETVMSVAVAILGAMTGAIVAIHTLPGLMLVMFVEGGAWIAIASLMNTLVQTLAPDWVRARMLAMFMLVTQGGLAAGSVVWGIVASHASVDAGLLGAGVGTFATAALGLAFRLPDHVADLRPWNHWRMPALIETAQVALDGGPVLVTVEYDVPRSDAQSFLEAIRRSGKVRRRDGASRWGIFRDVERPEVYLESFVVSSWAEHLRQHERLTHADSAVEQDVRRYTRGEPTIRHLIYAQSDE